MIYFFSPYSEGQDLGKAYNNYIRFLPSSEDWICLTDLDTMFLTPNIGHQLQEIVNIYPDTGLFTCLTNRVGNLSQCYNGIISEDSSLLNHKRIASQLYKERRIEVREVDHCISGMLMLIKKSVWEQIGEFPEGRGLLGVDNLISRKILAHGLKIRIMMGVYLVHFYRMDVGIADKSHLQLQPQNPAYNEVRRARKKSRFI